MKLLGEKIEKHISVPYLSTPTNPLLNIYLPHLLYLTKVKMRIGHALARQATTEQAQNAAKYVFCKSFVPIAGFDITIRFAFAWIMNQPLLCSSLSLPSSHTPYFAPHLFLSSSLLIV